MKQKIYLFLSTSIPYGIAMGLFLSDDFASFLRNGVLGGIIFGLLMTVLLLFIQRKNIDKQGYKGDPKVSVTAEIKIEGTKQEIFQMCQNSLGTIVKCTIEVSDIQNGVLKAKAGKTWLTWGDFITFKLEQLQENTYKLLITSRPIVKTTIIDYGKNQDNVNRIIGYFKEVKGDVEVIQDGRNIF